MSAKRADFNKWAKEFHISPVLARILRNRDLTEEEQVNRFLNGTLKDCYSPWLLRGMDQAVELILQAAEAGTRIRVIGDYDVDGICSSYILTKGLEILGARVDAAIPHRIHDGYGLNEHLILEAAGEGVELIVTCDNGIAAAAQIETAKELGIPVIVTDHHEVPYEEEGGVRREKLPDAAAVIDPKQEKCTYPFPGICGAVVAYKLILALAEKGKKPELAQAAEEFLEFAALATVCDVMELKDENRILVREGLKRLRNTANPGLRALIEVNGLRMDQLTAYHLGFVIGPCLNATGRLDTAARALELLQSGSLPRAMKMAGELKEMNDSRKTMTVQGVELAEAYIKEHHLERDKVMVIYLPQVHESLAGIIAGRIRERHHHPVFLLTKGEEGVKGSGRSTEGYHMYRAMTETQQYFVKFGGHAMAAGFSMKEEDIEPLRRALNQNCHMTEEDFIPRVHIDVPMPLDYAGEELARQLTLLEPFGTGNPKPLFAQKDLLFLSGARMGEGGRYARFQVRTPEGNEKQVVFFGEPEQFDAFLDEKFGSGSAAALYGGRGGFPVSVAYQLGSNTYRGRTQVQYVMQYYC